MAVNAHNLLKQKGFTQDLGAPLANPGFSLSASHLHEIVPGAVARLTGEVCHASQARVAAHPPAMA